MSRSTLARRLAAVEQRQVEDDGAVAHGAAEFYRRFLRLVDHYQGCDPGPGASLAAQWAADLWHNADALAKLRATAAAHGVGQGAGQ